jgi:hypothetical protein
VPFWPGGLDNLLDDVTEERGTKTDISALRSTPPGFMRGLRLPDDEAETSVILNIASAHSPKRGMSMVLLHVLRGMIILIAA